MPPLCAIGKSEWGDERRGPEIERCFMREGTTRRMSDAHLLMRSRVRNVCTLTHEYDRRCRRSGCPRSAALAVRAEAVTDIDHAPSVVVAVVSTRLGDGDIRKSKSRRIRMSPAPSLASSLSSRGVARPSFCVHSFLFLFFGISRKNMDSVSPFLSSQSQQV